MSSRLIVPLLLAGAIALACGTRSHSDASAIPLASMDKVVQPKKVKLLDGEPPLASAFSVSRAEHGITFALALTNPGKKNVEVVFPSGHVYDFSVEDTAGREVYRWGTGRMFTQSRQNRMLDGGDTMQIEESATPTLPQGS